MDPNKRLEEIACDLCDAELTNMTDVSRKAEFSVVIISTECRNDVCAAHLIQLLKKHDVAIDCLEEITEEYNGS